MQAEEKEFSAGRGVYSLEHSGLGMRILDAWRDMRASTRRLLREKPGEARLILYVVASDMVFFLSWSLKTMVAPVEGVDPLVSPDKIGLLMAGALMLRTSVMYLFSLLVFLASRILHGQGSWKETRAAVFWGALVSAPFGLAAALLSVGIGILAPHFPILNESWVALPVYWLGLIPFVWFISAGVAEAQRYKMSGPTFMAMSVLALGLTIAALLWGQGGMVG